MGFGSIESVSLGLIRAADGSAVYDQTGAGTACGEDMTVLEKADDLNTLSVVKGYFLTYTNGV